MAWGLPGGKDIAGFLLAVYRVIDQLRKKILTAEEQAQTAGDMQTLQQTIEKLEK